MNRMNTISRPPPTSSYLLMSLQAAPAFLVERAEEGQRQHAEDVHRRDARAEDGEAAKHRVGREQTDEDVELRDEA